MFYQYFRGRQYELLALRATAETIAKSRKIIPVVEPVARQLRGLEVAAETLFDSGAPLVLITNPTARKGEWEGTVDLLREADFPTAVRDHTKLIPAHIVLVGSARARLTSFLRRYDGRPVAIIHQERCTDAGDVVSATSAHNGGVAHLFIDGGTPKSHRDLFPRKRRGLIRDGFRRQPKNALYPADEFFSDLYATYKAEGYAGFGDYSIVGDFFRIGGGSARAVAIHLTYHRPAENAIYCRHFVSDSNDTTSDQAAKFMEAAEKAARFIRKHPEVRTNATDELLEYHAAQHFPGLSKLKELGMRHHIELMSQLVS